jgi:pyruvate/2-oxoglutarate dehydrogenase complex dihydrolipoamide dehydrogenase (E3) component
VDLILIAVGLSASNKILSQMGCENTYVDEMGAWLPLHNECMETTVAGIYLAGDAGGIAEASTAMLEGKLAAAAIAEKEGCDGEEVAAVREIASGELAQIRESAFLKTVGEVKEKCHQRWQEAKRA